MIPAGIVPTSGLTQHTLDRSVESLARSELYRQGDRCSNTASSVSTNLFLLVVLRGFAFLFRLVSPVSRPYVKS